MTKPIVIADDMEMVSSPVMIDFTVNEKALSAPHKHSKNEPAPASALSSAQKSSRKRGRAHGNRRNELQEEVRLLLDEAEEMMDIDDDDLVDLTSPSPAANLAVKMLSRPSSVVCIKGTQPPATLSRGSSGRKPVQKFDGAKRSCCSTAMSISPAPLYAEVA